MSRDAQKGMPNPRLIPTTSAADSINPATTPNTMAPAVKASVRPKALRASYLEQLRLSAATAKAGASSSGGAQSGAQSGAEAPQSGNTAESGAEGVG